MDPEGSLPHLKKPVTCPNPESINPIYSPTHLSKIHFNIILPSTPRSSKGCPFLGFPTKTLYEPLLSPYTAHFIRLDLITRMEFGE